LLSATDLLVLSIFSLTKIRLGHVVLAVFALTVDQAHLWPVAQMKVLIANLTALGPYSWHIRFIKILVLGNFQCVYRRIRQVLETFFFFHSATTVFI
jgi:hypothetical protein